MSTATALTFLGGAGTVTGSRFVIEDRDARVLVDFGLFQGPYTSYDRRNWERFPVDPASIDAVVVAHAHLDHSGPSRAGPRRLRRCVVCTPDTAALAAIVLRDSARLQEEDATYASTGGVSKHSPPLPLYTTADAEHVLSLFTPANFGDLVELAPDMSVVLRPAGHVLGSSTAELRVAGRTAVFTGDLGRSTHPLLRPPASPPAAELIVTESTYGNRAQPAADLDTFAGVLDAPLAAAGSRSSPPSRSTGPRSCCTRCACS